jgi:hypothetical protein
VSEARSSLSGMFTLTDVLAILAIVLSTASLAWQVFAHVLNGSRLRLGTKWAWDPVRDIEGIVIIARNVGRLPARISEVGIEVDLKGSYAPLPLLVPPPVYSPGSMPIEIPPGGEVSWMVSNASLAGLSARCPDAGQWRALVRLGSGKIVYSPRGIAAPALPGTP